MKKFHVHTGKSRVNITHHICSRKLSWSGEVPGVAAAGGGAAGSTVALAMIAVL